MFGYKVSDYDKKVYEEELKDFLPKNIVDSHTHVFLNEHLYKNRPVSWVSMLCDDNSIEGIRQTYKDFFPDKNVVPVIFGMPTHKREEENQYISQCIKDYKYPGLFLTHYDNNLEYIERGVVEGGFQGLKPYLANCKEGVNPSEANIYDFLPENQLKLADKYGWKIIVHISKSLRLKDPMNVKQLMDIEQKYPNIKLIVAHIGRAYTPEDFGDAFDTLKHTKNMIFDFSANTLPEATERCINAVGTKRVLFGSDLPVAKMKMYRICESNNYINVVPRGEYGNVDGVAHIRESDEKTISNFMYEIVRGFKQTAKKLTLSRQDIEDIMCNNAMKLYDIKF